MTDTVKKKLVKMDSRLEDISGELIGLMAKEIKAGGTDAETARRIAAVQSTIARARVMLLQADKGKGANEMETIEEYQANIDRMEKQIFDALGPEKAYQEINKALGYDTRKDIYDYIIRMWDLNYKEGGEK